MGCGVSRQQANEVGKAIGSLRRLGIPEIAPELRQLLDLRSKILAQIGVKLPRTMSLIVALFGLSPGSIKLWHDSESGWMSEARARPGAPPVYKAVSEEIASVLIKRELTHELEEKLLTPDTDIDN